MNNAVILEQEIAHLDALIATSVTLLVTLRNGCPTVQSAAANQLNIGMVRNVQTGTLQTIVLVLVMIPVCGVIFQKNPGMEIVRLVDVYQSRETHLPISIMNLGHVLIGRAHVLMTANV